MRRHTGQACAGALRPPLHTPPPLPQPPMPRPSRLTLSGPLLPSTAAARSISAAPSAPPSASTPATACGWLAANAEPSAGAALPPPTTTAEA